VSEGATTYRVDLVSFVRSALAGGVVALAVCWAVGGVPVVVVAVLAVVVALLHDLVVERVRVGPGGIVRGGWAVRPRTLPFATVRLVDVERRDGGSEDGPIDLLRLELTDRGPVTLVRYVEAPPTDLLLDLRSRGLPLGAGAQDALRDGRRRDTVVRWNRRLTVAGTVVAAGVLGATIGTLPF